MGPLPNGSDPNHLQPLGAHPPSRIVGNEDGILDFGICWDVNSGIYDSKLHKC